MKICLIVPTLNEEKNILLLFKKIKIQKIQLDLLFVDDNSSDKSQEIIISLKKKYRFVKYIFRKNKVGIGSAHRDGIKFCYKNKYNIVITMDADGTHDPKLIKKMIKLTLNKKNQIISTNRFLNKNSLKNWSLWRKVLTYLRYYLIILFLKTKYDSSGAYRCYNIDLINLKDILKAKSDDYSFFWESLFFLSKKYNIYEIPINLPARSAGQSKMKIKHIYQALIYLLKFFYLQKIKK